MGFNMLASLETFIVEDSIYIFNHTYMFVNTTFLLILNITPFF